MTTYNFTFLGQISTGFLKCSTNRTEFRLSHIVFWEDVVTTILEMKLVVPFLPAFTSYSFSQLALSARHAKHRNALEIRLRYGWGSHNGGNKRPHALLSVRFQSRKRKSLPFQSSSYDFRVSYFRHDEKSVLIGGSTCIECRNTYISNCHVLYFFLIPSWLN